MGDTARLPNSQVQEVSMPSQSVEDEAAAIGVQGMIWKYSERERRPHGTPPSTDANNANANAGRFTASNGQVYSAGEVQEPAAPTSDGLFTPDSDPALVSRAGNDSDGVPHESNRSRRRAERAMRKEQRAMALQEQPIPAAEVQESEAQKDLHSPAPGSDPGLISFDDEQTLHEESNPYKSHKIIVEDWSETGRGSHIEFEKEETVPLKEGRWLGHGATGHVYETTVKGWQVAHKRLLMNRKTLDVVQREVDILKRLSTHVHVVQLIGTYTHRQFLGLLMYPVAVCDVSDSRYLAPGMPKTSSLVVWMTNTYLASGLQGSAVCFSMLSASTPRRTIIYSISCKLNTFFEDVEAWTATASETSNMETRLGKLDSDRKARLGAMGYVFPAVDSHASATPIYSRLGCLVSAIVFLHEEKNKIRHKDLKPSNILLSPDHLWLSDFGSATDFSLLSQSATDNGGGTLRYLSPEVAAWEPAGRAADVFSLGCVLLEIVVLHDRGTLEPIRQNRSNGPSFHSNLHQADIWCKPASDDTCPTLFHILREIRSMLEKKPSMRPTAHEVLTRVTGYDLADTRPDKQTIFGHCCATSLVHNAQRRAEKALANEELRILREALDKSRNDKAQMQQQLKELQTAFERSQDECRTVREEKEQDRHNSRNDKAQIQQQLKEFQTAFERSQDECRTLREEKEKDRLSAERVEEGLLRQLQEERRRPKKQQSELQLDSIAPPGSYIIPLHRKRSRSPYSGHRSVMSLEDSELENELASLPASRETQWEQIYVDGDTKLAQRSKMNKDVYDLASPRPRLTTETKKERKHQLGSYQEREQIGKQLNLGSLRQGSESQQTRPTPLVFNGKDDRTSRWAIPPKFPPNFSRPDDLKSSASSSVPASQSPAPAVNAVPRRENHTSDYASSDDFEDQRIIQIRDEISKGDKLQPDAPTKAERSAADIAEGVAKLRRILAPPRRVVPAPALKRNKETEEAADPRDIEYRRRVSPPPPKGGVRFTKKGKETEKVPDQQDSQELGSLGHDAIGNAASKSNDSLVAEPGEERLVRKPRVRGLSEERPSSYRFDRVHPPKPSTSKRLMDFIAGRAKS